MMACWGVPKGCVPLVIAVVPETVQLLAQSTSEAALSLYVPDTWMWFPLLSAGDTWRK